MIEGKIFQNLSRRLGIKSEAIERDYVMNLILDAFAHCPSTQNTFFFKGGCCVHKCFSQHVFDADQPIDSYFTSGRFSSDIDLTVTPEMMNTDALMQAFQEVKEYVAARHGLIINQFSFPIYKNNKQQIENKSKLNCRGIIHFEGPMYNRKFNSPAMKFDITADERVVFEPYKRIIYHPYSNQGEETLLIAKTYTLRDMFAEKIRALYERCSPRDLYDLCILRLHPDMDDYRQIGIGLSIMEKFMLKNMDYNISMSALNRTGKNGVPLIQDCEQSWNQSLQRQVIRLPEFESYAGCLPEIIRFAVHCIQKADQLYTQFKRQNQNQPAKVVMRDLLTTESDTQKDYRSLINEMLTYEKMRGHND